MNAWATEVAFDMYPLLNWLDRNRPQSAEQEKRRTFHFLDEAPKCAMLDLPCLKGGEVHETDYSNGMSADVKKYGEFLVWCQLFSVALANWANEIQDEQEDPLLDVNQIAERFNVTVDSAKAKLQRYRSKNLEGFTEDTERPRNRPRFRYQLSKIQHLFQGPQ